MFDDRRSKKVVLVAHCVLNQNAKIDRCAHYPGAMRQLALGLIDAGVGIVQMPCPEMVCLGLDRQADGTTASSVASEDTRVAKLMSEPMVRAVCAKLAGELIDQVREYRKHGFQVAGIIGINGSPTCGVETNWSEDVEAAGPGVFIRALQEGLAREGEAIPIRGVKARLPEDACGVVEQLLSTAESAAIESDRT